MVAAVLGPPLPDERHEREDAALAAVVSPHDEDEVLDRHDDGQRPEDEAEHPEHVPGRRLDSVVAVEALAQGVERTCADVAVDDAQRPQAQREQLPRVEGPVAALLMAVLMAVVVSEVVSVVVSVIGGFGRMDGAGRRGRRRGRGLGGFGHAGRRPGAHRRSSWSGGRTLPCFRRRPHLSAVSRPPGSEKGPSGVKNRGFSPFRRLNGLSPGIPVVCMIRVRRGVVWTRAPAGPELGRVGPRDGGGFPCPVRLRRVWCAAFRASPTGASRRPPAAAGRPFRGPPCPAFKSPSKPSPPSSAAST